MAGKHFNLMSSAAPMTNDTTIKIVLVLMLIGDLKAGIYDVKGMFLKGNFEDGE